MYSYQLIMTVRYLKSGQIFEQWDCFDDLGNNLKYCFTKVNSILKMEIFVTFIVLFINLFNYCSVNGNIHLLEV